MKNSYQKETRSIFRAWRGLFIVFVILIAATKLFTKESGSPNDIQKSFQVLATKKIRHYIHSLRHETIPKKPLEQKTSSEKSHVTFNKKKIAVALVIIGVISYCFLYEDKQERLYRQLKTHCYLLQASHFLRTNYSNLTLDDTCSKNFALVNLNGQMTYGAPGANSLSSVANMILKLAQTKNKGLVIVLEHPFNNPTEDSKYTYGPSLTLQEAITAYLTKTDKKVLAFSKHFTPKSYLIAVGAHTIHAPVSSTVELPWFFLHSTLDKVVGLGSEEREFKSENIFEPVISNNDTGEITAGKYKKAPPREDAIAIMWATYREVFNKAVQLHRKEQIKNKQNIVSKLYNFVRSTYEIFKIEYTGHSFLKTKELPVAHALSAGYIDDKSEHPEALTAKCQKIYTYPVPKLPTYEQFYPENYWKDVNTPAIEVVFIKGEFRKQQMTPVIELLKHLAIHPQSKGLVLVIDSPGGFLSISKEMVSVLHTLKKSGKKLCAYTETYCCSAGYSAASVCDHIIARETAVVGSIGVVIADNTTSDTSAAKDFFQIITSYFKTLIIKQDYNDFLDEISQNRHEKVDKTKESYRNHLIGTQARSFPAKCAQEALFVDQIGTLQDAISWLQHNITEQCSVFYHECISPQDRVISPKKYASKSPSWKKMLQEAHDCGLLINNKFDPKVLSGIR